MPPLLPPPLSMAAVVRHSSAGFFRESRLGRGGSCVNDFDLPSHQSIKNLHVEHHPIQLFPNLILREWKISNLLRSFVPSFIHVWYFHFLLYCRKPLSSLSEKEIKVNLLFKLTEILVLFEMNWHTVLWSKIENLRGRGKQTDNGMSFPL